jgi:hypothetical protein
MLSVGEELTGRASQIPCGEQHDDRSHARTDTEEGEANRMLGVPSEDGRHKGQEEWAEVQRRV